MPEQLKILIADDEADVLRVMSKKITAAGYEVLEAADGQQAWDRIQSGEPDIIILDLTMPGLDGFEVLRKVRLHPPGLKWQPVIIVSAREDLEDMKKGFSLEADHYITKPCQIEDILRAIRVMTQLLPHRKTAAEMEG